jgi:2'-5' RNA ligase
MRVFIAVDINEQVKSAVKQLQKRLIDATSAGSKDIAWVRPDAMHLTLKFLGEINDNLLVQVCNTVKEAVAGHKGFDLDIENVGSFGGKSARVLWIGSGAGSEEITKIAQDIEQRLEKIGFSKEARLFTVHLTLCRIKSFKAGLELANLAEDYKDFKAGTVFIDSIKVYQSQLTPTGPIYTVLGSYLLG